MAQTTLDDDDLFDEAASEIQADVEESLDRARAELPAAEAVWSVDADNTLGVLNTLRTALDAGEAADHLRDAKKWYTMGEQAGAFEDDDGLAEEIATVEELITDLESASEEAGELATTIPGLKDTLEAAEE